jgi:hypothetical protein
LQQVASLFPPVEWDPHRLHEEDLYERETVTVNDGELLVECHLVHQVSENETSFHAQKDHLKQFEGGALLLPSSSVMN